MGFFVGASDSFWGREDARMGVTSAWHLVELPTRLIPVALLSHRVSSRCPHNPMIVAISCGSGVCSGGEGFAVAACPSLSNCVAIPVDVWSVVDE